MSELSDKELNIKLAEALGYEEFMNVDRIEWVSDTSKYRPQEFSYKDPAIFAECVLWLTKAGYDFFEDDGLFFNKGLGECHDKDPYRAVALAYIKAKENE